MSALHVSDQAYAAAQYVAKGHRTSAQHNPVADTARLNIGTTFN
jgi:hypothetical protein